MFLPNGQAPLSGLFTRRLDLAAILDAVADKGISEFYNGNLTHEIAATVRFFFFSACISVSLEGGNNSAGGVNVLDAYFRMIYV